MLARYWGVAGDADSGKSLVVDRWYRSLVRGVLVARLLARCWGIANGACSACGACGAGGAE